MNSEEIFITGYSGQIFSTILATGSQIIAGHLIEVDCILISFLNS